MKFKLTRKAKSDLDNIWNYTQITWGAEQADIYIDILYNRFLWLTSNPSLWRQRDDIVEGLYSYHESSHIMGYHARITEKFHRRITS